MLTNIAKLFIVTAPYNPGSIAANTVVADASFAVVPGVRLGDIVVECIKPTVTAGLGHITGRVTADNQIQVSFVNATAAPIDAPAEVWTFMIATPDPGLKAESLGT